MWFCFSDGFISAVQHRDDPATLVVRARRRDILDVLFPEYKVIVGGSTDYNYRVFIDKKDFNDIVSRRIQAIDYANFKNSVEDDDLHQLYADFWQLHYEYQK
jgi:hypothetical protein